MPVRELHRPRRVLIAGGGTAGWITAFLLRSTAPPDVTITVVDSAADAPALGAGESTLPGFRHLLRSAGIDEGEFFAETDATFRLGTRFRQWNPARDFWHPFGAVLGPSVLVTDWLRTAARDGGAAIDEVLDQGTGKVAAARLAPQSAVCPPYTGELRAFGYHADTARLADLVRGRAIAAGVRRVPDDVTDAEVGPGGWIRQVRTAAHGPLEADLFFDCTGFRGQLIRQALGEPFDPFSRHLWCDKAVTIDVPAEPAASADPPPYTVSTARSAGWIWEIPLYSRSCAGYVYSSAYPAARATSAPATRAYGKRGNSHLPAMLRRPPEPAVPNRSVMFHHRVRISVFSQALTTDDSASTSSYKPMVGAGASRELPPASRPRRGWWGGSA